MSGLLGGSWQSCLEGNMKSRGCVRTGPQMTMFTGLEEDLSGSPYRSLEALSSGRCAGSLEGGLQVRVLMVASCVSEGRGDEVDLAWSTVLSGCGARGGEMYEAGSCRHRSE